MSIPELSPIEERIVFLVAEGESVEAIAGEVGVAPRTVAWHLARARRKLERTTTLHDRVEQAARSAAGRTRPPTAGHADCGRGTAGGV